MPAKAGIQTYPSAITGKKTGFPPWKIGSFFHGAGMTNKTPFLSQNQIISRFHGSFSIASASPA